MVSEISDDEDELGSSEVEAGTGEDDAMGVAILVVRSLGCYIDGTTADRSSAGFGVES